jgi:hypothetical protein
MATRKTHTIGTDPEFFLKRGKEYISAIPHIGDEEHGTKYAPIALTTVDKACVQRDNVAVEFASPPVETKEEFVESIRGCLREISSMIPKGTSLEAVPSANFPEAELDHPEAQQFGCDPDYDAWKVEQNEKPYCGISTFRSCGGHVHVGGIQDDGTPIPGMEFLLEFEGKLAMVRAMDIMLGVPSTVLDCSKAAVARRQLYGKAGCHRIPEHGIEYRTLSNYWLRSPELVMLVYSLTQDAVHLVQSGHLEELINTLSAEEIQRIINNGDVESATKAIERHILNFMSVESKELFDMCIAKVPKIKKLSVEWGI